MPRFFSKLKFLSSKEEPTTDSDQQSNTSRSSFSLSRKFKRKSEPTLSHHDPQSIITVNINEDSIPSPDMSTSNTIPSPRNNQQAEASSATTPTNDDQPPVPHSDTVISCDANPPSPMAQSQPRLSAHNQDPTLPLPPHAQTLPDTAPAIKIHATESELAIGTPLAASPQSAHLHKKALEIAREKLAEKDWPFLEQLAGEWKMEVLVGELQTAHESWQMKTVNGKRMGKILKSVENYAKIVDIGIQHSPEITSLVWAGMRTILQIAQNHSEAIECFETTIAIVTDKMATCNFYASIYAEISLDSRLLAGGGFETQNTLDTALPRLWASVIVFSIKARQYFNAKWITKVGNMIMPFAVEFQSFIDDINESANVVRICADGATMKRIKEHSEVLARMEGLLDNIKSEMKPLLQLNEISYATAEVLKHTLSAEEEQLLELLSPLEPLKRHSAVRSTRVENTGAWILELQSFRSWCDGSFTDTKGRVLCCYGMPGAGKTFISSLVIDHIENKLLEQANTAIACLYCDYRDQAKQTVLNILGTFIHQFLSRHSLPQILEETIRTLKNIKKERKSLEVPHAVKILNSIFQQLTPFICIDALDELEPANRAQLLDIFRSELKIDTTKIFLTGRRHIQTEVNRYLRTERNICSEMHLQANPSDIQQYLTNKIAQDAMSNPEAMNDELKGHILDTITRQSQGMFLLPALQIDMVLVQPTRSKRRKALEKLPSDLYTTFGTVVERIKQSPRHADLGLRILTWLHLARRPLKVNELQHALSVEPDQEQLDEDNIPSQSSILASCLGLVIVDDETATVRLVHYSLEEYFQKHTNEHFPNGHSMIAEICLTYLNFKGLRETVRDAFTGFDGITGYSGWMFNLFRQAEIEERENTYLFLSYAALNWSYYAKKQSNNRTDELAVKLLHHDYRCPPCPIQLIFIYENGAAFFHSDEADWTLFSGIHVAAFVGLTGILQSLLKAQLGDAKGPDDKTPLIYAAEQGHEAVVRLLLEQENIDVNKADNGGRTVLSYAAGRGKEAVVRLLLEQENFDFNKADNDGRTVLSYAAGGGNEAVVQLLLEQENVDVNNANNYGKTMLSYAGEGGHEAVVRLLLEQENIDVNKADNYGRTVLAHAVRRRKEAVVRLLLEQENIDVTKADDYSRTVLSHAAEDGNEAVVRLLLEQENIDVNNADFSGRTVLSYAAGGGYEAVVRLLLEQENIDVTATDTHGRTGLSHAAGSGKEAIVRLLLEQENHDVNKVDNLGRTVLSYAAGGGNEAVVRLLLEQENVDVNNANIDGRTVLSYAAEDGNYPVVRLLLEQENFDFNKADNDGRTVLSYAAGGGDEAVVQLLLEQENVDVNNANNYGRTVLSYAAEDGNVSVVRLLLEQENIDATKADNRGRTVLSYASRGGNEAVVRLLLEQGNIDVNNADNSGRTVLSYAAEQGHEAVVRLLLEQENIDVNRADNDGRTVLSHAAGNGDEDVVRLLIKQENIDVNKVDDFGETALSYAGTHWLGAAVVELLRSRGAS